MLSSLNPASPCEELAVEADSSTQKFIYFKTVSKNSTQLEVNQHIEEEKKSEGLPSASS